MLLNAIAHLTCDENTCVADFIQYFSKRIANLYFSFGYFYFTRNQKKISAVFDRLKLQYAVKIKVRKLQFPELL